jgi:hypothetical protein
MHIDTKFDIGNRVYVIDMSNRLHLTKIIELNAHIDCHNELIVGFGVRLHENKSIDWFYHPNVFSFSDEEMARQAEEVWGFRAITIHFDQPRAYRSYKVGHTCDPRGFDTPIEEWRK